jgi:ATP-dependent DNA ligase
MARSPRLTTVVPAEDDLPAWVKPELTRLVTETPSGDEWAHELKFDDYRMHARLDRGDVRLLTRIGLDWTAKYTAVAAALSTIPGQVYLDGELCGVRPDGVTSFALIQNAVDRRGGADLVVLPKRSIVETRPDVNALFVRRNAVKARSGR